MRCRCFLLAGRRRDHLRHRREIWSGVRRQGYVELGLYLLGAGFLLGIATDLVVAYGGG